MGHFLTSFFQEEGGRLSLHKPRTSRLHEIPLVRWWLWITPIHLVEVYWLTDFCWSSTDRGKDKDVRGDSRDSVKTACFPSTQNLVTYMIFRHQVDTKEWKQLTFWCSIAGRSSAAWTLGQSTCVARLWEQRAWWYAGTRSPLSVRKLGSGGIPAGVLPVCFYIYNLVPHHNHALFEGHG